MSMKVPQLKKKPELKSCHNTTWEDNYSWIHQKDILEVLKDKNKLNPEVREYLEQENSYAEFHLKDTKNLQKKLFNEIKGRIKLDDESLPYIDHTYEYWTKTTAKGNYSIKLRKKIGTDLVEEYWNGDEEKEKLNTEYFGIGDLEVSYDDKSKIIINGSPTKNDIEKHDGYIKELNTGVIKNIQDKKIASDNVIIYGAGAAGAQLASIFKLENSYNIISFIDDDKSLWGRSIYSIQIRSPSYINKTNQKIDKILLAMPSINLSRRKFILKKLSKFDIPVYQIPLIQELISGKEKINKDVLTIKPAGNIESLRKNHRSIKNILISPNEEKILENISGNSIEILLTAEVKDLSLIHI